MIEASLGSLYIETFFNNTSLMMGTGFIVMIDKSPFLITNRHNVTGRSQVDNHSLHQFAGVPNKIKIYHHKRGLLGIEWIETFEILYKDMDSFNTPLWIEHPLLKEKADVVALKLTEIKEAEYPYYPIKVMESKLILTPTESISVIGFPFGKNAGENKKQMLPIWVNGFLASEPEIDIDGIPVFLIDCRSREVQSGSPVIAFRNGITKFKNNNLLDVTNYIELLGVYSGRINEKSDIGKVWKVSVIKELMEYIKQI